MWYIYLMEYQSAIKNKLIHQTTGMNLKMVCQFRETWHRRVHAVLITFYEISTKSKNLETESRFMIAWDWGLEIQIDCIRAQWNFLHVKLDCDGSTPISNFIKIPTSNWILTPVGEFTSGWIFGIQIIPK